MLSSLVDPPNDAVVLHFYSKSMCILSKISKSKMIVSLEGLDKNDDIQNLVASENNFSFLRVKNIISNIFRVLNFGTLFRRDTTYLETLEIR